jgi:hypothetical protein
MSAKTVILLRGLSGSGKTSLAKVICGDNPRSFMRSADDFMCLYTGDAPEGRKGPSLDEDDPVLAAREAKLETVEVPDWDERLDPHSYDPELEYRWSGHLLGRAHRWCAGEVDRLLLSHADLIVVHNTFDQRWTMEPYFRLAAAHEAQVFVPDLWDGGCDLNRLVERNGHEVPVDSILRMKAGWHHQWRGKEARPPWEVREESVATHEEISRKRDEVEAALAEGLGDSGGT